MPCSRPGVRSAVVVRLLCASACAPLLILACSHDWDAFNVRGGGGAAPDGGGGGGGTGGSTTQPDAGAPDAEAGTDAAADGAVDSGPTHVTEGLVALYDFEEGEGYIVHDVSDVPPPLDLVIADPMNVTWIPGGLSVDQATLISSPGPATKVVEACQATNEITLDIWFQPNNLMQAGPARLITNSADPSNRNFQLGQEGASFYQARLRTNSSTPNGAPYLQTPTDAGDVTLDLTHLVFTCNAAGERYLYVNGEIRDNDTVDAGFDTWDAGWGLAMANEMTLDRIWLGQLYRAAIYNRALSDAEVAQNHRAGP